MAWEEEKQGWCWGFPVKVVVDRKVFELLTPYLGQSIAGSSQCQELKIKFWGEAGNLWHKRGEACLGNSYLLGSVGQRVDTTVFLALSLAEGPWL